MMMYRCIGIKITFITVNIKKNITGKKINSVEVLVKVASDNQNQKKFN